MAPLTVHAAPTLPVVQAPASWHGTLGLAFVTQAVPKVAPAFVHVPTFVQSAGFTQALPRLSEFVQVPTLSQSVLTAQTTPTFPFVHIGEPTAGHWPLTLQLVAAFEQVPVSGQPATLTQTVAGALLQ